MKIKQLCVLGYVALVVSGLGAMEQQEGPKPAGDGSELTEVTVVIEQPGQDAQGQNQGENEMPAGQPVARLGGDVGGQHEEVEAGQQEAEPQPEHREEQPKEQKRSRSCLGECVPSKAKMWEYWQWGKDVKARGKQFYAWKNAGIVDQKHRNGYNVYPFAKDFPAENVRGQDGIIAAPASEQVLVESAEGFVFSVPKGLFKAAGAETVKVNLSVSELYLALCCMRGLYGSEQKGQAWRAFAAEKLAAYTDWRRGDWGVLNDCLGIYWLLRVVTEINPGERFQGYLIGVVANKLSGLQLDTINKAIHNLDDYVLTHKRRRTLETLITSLRAAVKKQRQQQLDEFVAEGDEEEGGASSSDVAEHADLSSKSE